MADTKIPTPRTDRAVLVNTYRPGMPSILVHGVEVVGIHVARELERELHEAEEKLSKIQEILK